MFEAHGGVHRWLLGKRLAASLQITARSTGGLKVSTVEIWLASAQAGDLEGAS